MIEPIEAVPVIELLDYNGDCVALVGAVSGLYRDNGDDPGPDDVLSVQRDGMLQTRPAGACGSFERCRKVDAGLLAYQPDGGSSPVYLVPYRLTSDLPNH